MSVGAAEPKWISFQFVTKNRWTSGRVETRYNRLIDLLNSDHISTINVHKATSVRPGEVPEPETGLQVLVAVHRILFAAPLTSATAAEAPGDNYWLVQKEQERAVIGIGQYEIVGKVHLPRQATLGVDFLTTGLPFYAVTEASIRLVDGAPVADLPVIVVNRRRTEYIASAE